MNEIRLKPHETGVGVLLWRDGRPIAFLLQEIEPSSTLPAADVDGLIARSAAYEILADGVRTELSPPPTHLDTRSLTIAICTHAREAYLDDCLRSILRLRIKPDTQHFDILVVDNAPPNESTRSLVESFEGVRYVREDRPGLDFARNRALLESESDFIAFLDDDVEIGSSWVSGFAEAVTENPDVGAITGLVMPYELDTDAQISFERRGGFRRGFAKRRYRGPVLPGNSLYPVGAGIFGAGCNMVLRREVAQDIGGFDEALDTGPPLPGGGDLDMFFRIIRAGNPLVYEPRMIVFHKHRREHRALLRQYWTWGTGMMAFVDKTYANDFDKRAQLRELQRWWVMNGLRELKLSLKSGQLPADLILAEFVGGLVGMAGAYSRSHRRIKKIKAEHQ